MSFKVQIASHDTVAIMRCDNIWKYINPKLHCL